MDSLGFQNWCCGVLYLSTVDNLAESRSRKTSIRVAISVQSLISHVSANASFSIPIMFRRYILLSNK